MNTHEKELLETLSSSRILTSMITPALLISACKQDKTAPT